MTNRMESLNLNAFTSGLMVGTRHSSLPERHWEKVNDLKVILDIVVAVGNVQLALGDA